MEPTILPDENGVWRRGEMSCGACKGTGEVEDDSEREGDNTNKGDGDDTR